MKRWFALVGCVLGVTACSDQPQPTAPRARADLLGGLVDQLPQLSGVIAFPQVSDGISAPGPADALSPTAPNVGTNVAMNQDNTTRPQNETPIAVDPNNSSRLFSGANDYRNFAVRCGV